MVGNFGWYGKGLFHTELFANEFSHSGGQCFFWKQGHTGELDVFDAQCQLFGFFNHWLSGR